MVAVSDWAISSAANNLRESPGRMSSLGVLRFNRERYGSMRITLVPSLISQPAVPRYLSWTPAEATDQEATPSRMDVKRTAAWLRLMICIVSCPTHHNSGLGLPPSVAGLAGRGRALPVNAGVDLD